MRCGFVGQESKLAGIGREQVVGRGEPAHFRHVHESGVGHQERLLLQFLGADVDPVVPVHIRLQVVVDQQVRGQEREIFSEVPVDPCGPFSPADIPGKESPGGLDPQDMGGDAGRRQQGGSTARDGNRMLFEMQTAVLETAGAFVEGEILTWDGSDNQPGHRLKSSS